MNMHGITFAQVEVVAAGTELAKLALQGGPALLLALAVAYLGIDNRAKDKRIEGLNAATLAREESHSRRVEELLLKQAETKEALDAVNAAMSRLADRLPAGGQRP